MISSSAPPVTQRKNPTPMVLNPSLIQSPIDVHHPLPAASTETDYQKQFDAIERELRFKQMAWFLSTLFKGYELKGFIEFRFINKPMPTQTYWFQMEWLEDRESRIHHYKSLFQACERANQEGRAIYVGVLPRESQSGKAVNVLRALWWWADLDFKVADEDAILRILENHEAFPQAVVYTGGGYHAYWHLPNAANFNETSPLKFQKSLSRFQQFILPGADDISDLPHVMRLPGFINHKRDATVRLVNVVQGGLGA